MAPALRNILRSRQEAEALAAPFPSLLVEAERVAAIVAQGAHGRRRAGQGETFWQYRPYDTSDTANTIDWRRTARGQEVYVRDNEWEAAQSVWLWSDNNAGMNWSASAKVPLKSDRAKVLTLALAALLTRSGERCAVMGAQGRPQTGRIGMERVSQALASGKDNTEGLNHPIPAHAKLFLASDFLQPIDTLAKTLSQLSSRPAKGVLLHIVDPSERDFPFKGRMELRLPGALNDLPFMVGRAERAKEEYQRVFNAHLAALDDLAQHLGWPLVRHYTDSSPLPALTALYGAFSGEVTS
ncbi:MAG: DUF58 domain-containing protein [Maricaulaceae bacterium]